MNNNTIDYYNINAHQFTNSTINVNLTITQDHFLEYFPPASIILDLGCGSGRDTKYFISKGYQVFSTDGSRQLCEIATHNTGIQVKHQQFQELNEIEIYDGIWACSSILHLPLPELKEVMLKIHTALKQDGILYTSFKYGEFEGMRDGRYFTDMTEEKIKTLLSDIGIFEVLEQWITKDVRPERGDEKWLNLILKKT
jgi:SAM-dependent methyltransferase